MTLLVMNLKESIPSVTSKLVQEHTPPSVTLNCQLLAFEYVNIQEQTSPQLLYSTELPLSENSTGKQKRKLTREHMKSKEPEMM